MAHNLFGERFLGRREAAWHGLGTVFDENLVISPAEAIIRANCDYEVRKLPLTVKLPTGKNIPADRVALVRCPAPLLVPQPDGTYTQEIDPDASDYHVLGYASPNYEIVNNLELGLMLEEVGKVYPVETVGALGNGETLFISLNSGTTRLNNDDNEEIRLFLLVSNSHDGKRALKIMLTPVRVVCENTLIMATSTAILTASIPHSSSVKEETDFRLNLILNVRKQQDSMLEEFSALAKTPINAAQADAIFARAYPDPRPSRKALVNTMVTSDPKIMAMVKDDRSIAEKLLDDFSRNSEFYQKQVEKVEQLREGAKERFEVTGNISPGIAGTAWAAWQGITEVENYRGSSSKDTAASILFGERAQVMSRGYAACMELVK